MIPFPGESLGVDYAQVIGGADVTTELRYRAGSETLTSGDEWRAWVYPGGPTYLESGTAIAAAWAVEVLSGTVTLDASMGLDPMWGDTGASHGTSLGTHTVTGPATLVLSAPGLTADDLLTGGDAPMLVLEGTSGSAVVQQVKLRAWPPGGALGGWSPVQPGFTLSPTTPAAYHADFSVIGVEGGIPGAEDAWLAAMAELGSQPMPTAPHDFTSGTALTGVQAIGGVTSEGGGDYQGSGQVLFGMLVIEGEDWTDEYPIDGTVLTEETDYVRPPEEVQDDFAYWAQQIGSGGVEWVDAVAEVTAEAGFPLAVELGQPTLYAEALDGVTIVPLGGSAFEIDVPYTTGSPVISHPLTGTATTTVTMPTTGRYIVVSVGHTFALGTTPWPGWTPTLTGTTISTENDSATSLPDIKSSAVLPPYRVWDPNASVTFMRMMQRGDGLGMGSGRVLNAGTRQGSSKVFGTY